MTSSVNSSNSICSDGFSANKNSPHILADVKPMEKFHMAKNDHKEVINNIPETFNLMTTLTTPVSKTIMINDKFSEADSGYYNDLDSQSVVSLPEAPVFYVSTPAQSEIPADKFNFDCSATPTIPELNRMLLKDGPSIKEDDLSPIGLLPKIEIRSAYVEDIPNVCHWRHQELGYRAHCDYLTDLYDCYPSGWIVAVDDRGQIIGTIFGQNLDAQTGFGGIYSVKKAHRCQGIGGQLWKIRLNHFNNRNFGVNAVKSRVPQNQKLGMKMSFKMTRYFGLVSQSTIAALNGSLLAMNATPKIILLKLQYTKQERHPSPCDSTTYTPHFLVSSIPTINPITSEYFQNEESLVQSIIDYDTTVNTIARGKFIRHMISHEHTTTVVAIDLTKDQEPKVIGFGVLRPRYIGYTIGPLYSDNGPTAKSICFSLIDSLPIQQATHLDLTIIDDNAIIDPTKIQNEGNISSLESQTEERRITAHDIVTKLRLDQETTLYRMYSREEINLPMHKIYAFTTSEAFLA